MGNVYNLLFRKGITINRLLGFFLLIMLMINAAAMGQKMAINGKLIHSGSISKRTDQLSSIPYPEIHRQIRNYEIFNYDSRSFLNYVMPGWDVKKFQLILGDHKWDLVIWKNDARTSGYKLRAGDGKTTAVEVEPGQVTTYKGYVEGNEQMKVRINISEEHIQGVLMGDDVNYIIQTVSVFEKNNNAVNRNDLIMYESQDIDFFGAICGTPIGGMEDIQYENLRRGNEESAADEGALAWECAEIAIACDYGFQQKAGGVVAAETRLLEIFNFVQGYYDNLEIDHKIKEVYIDKNTSNNTWGSSNSASTLLSNFTNWGPGGFSTNYDLASLYSTRNFNNNGVIGLAYLNAVCKSNGYNVVEYYASWGNDYARHAVDQAHEMGHNWGTNHVNGSNYIMTPALSGYNRTWSSTATNNINSYRRSVSCQDAGKCVINEPPAAQFTADQTDGCGSLTVKFTDNSTNNPTAWLWDFGDGNTTTQQNPTHTYSVPDKYTVTLTTSNEFGSGKETKTQYISVGSGQPYTAFKGGPVNNSIGTGASFTANDLRGLFFNASADVVIESFLVYAGSAGARTIEVLSNASVTGAEGQVTGTVLTTKNVTIPAGESRVEVNIAVPAGNNYFIKLKGSVIDLYRNDTGTDYPYNITDNQSNKLIDITQSNANADALSYYYYFYDWEVRKAGCQTTTGIEDDNITGIVVYPNPVSDVFNIELTEGDPEGLEIRLYNLTGEVVYEKSFGTASGMDKYQISFGDIASGNYLLYVNAGDKVYSRKIMRE